MYILFVFAEVKPKVLIMHINMAVVFTQCKIIKHGMFTDKRRNMGGKVTPMRGKD